MDNEYQKKIDIFFMNNLKDIESPNIIEFGVRFGISTKKFIDICEKNNGFIHSVDVSDNSDVSDSKKWKFHHTRDDNFEYLDKVLPREVDVIYLDSFHNANHIEKIFYHYFPFLKVGGTFIFDDISWLPYIKDKPRNNFNCEINNQETFEKILGVQSQNEDCMDLYFSFVGSGSAKIIKKNDLQLKRAKKLKSRKSSFKNTLRRVFYSFRK